MVGSGRIGEEAIGREIGTAGLGRIQLGARAGRPVRQGFSGGGVWSPDYRAVVAVVSQVLDGDARAITLHEADKWFPDENISGLSTLSPTARADEATLAAWGWSLTRDRERIRHWRPRGRGVSVDSERGFRFRGRQAALRAIRDCLDPEETDRVETGPQVLVVTGAPGAGKSAVLGRIVTTADRAAAGQLPDSDKEVRATVGSVACAVHGKGKTALEIATEIAQAASASLPQTIRDFQPSLRRKFTERLGRRFNVIIDALDEAASPRQARIAIEEVIIPLAGICARAGGAVVVGSRRTDADGDLLSSFPDSARQVIDLDSTEFFEEKDLEDYTSLTLELAGYKRTANPYADPETAQRVATRIAELSQQNFLVAGLTARMHAWYDETAADPATLSFSATVDSAMREYLRRIPSVPVDTSASGATVPAEMLLTALAFAETPGLTVGLWQAALRALGAGEIAEEVLTQFARSSAANFLVESSGGNGQETTFRLFHQALNEALLNTRDENVDLSDDERALTRAFTAYGRAGQWHDAPKYLLRSLPAHAVRAGLVDDLLADDEYLLHSDLRRILQVTGQAVSRSARDRARLLGHTPEAVAADPVERVAMFGVTEILDGLGTAYRSGRWAVPYRAQWATAAHSREDFTLRDHQGPVREACAVQVGNRTLLATGGDDQTVRLWDPADGSHVRVLDSQQCVSAVCAVPVANRTLLAVGDEDGTVRLWDPAEGTRVRALEGRHGGAKTLCAVQVGDRTLLATAGNGDRKVRLWDPADGSHVRTLESHQNPPTALCAVQLGDRALLAVSDEDGTVRLWDPADGSHVRTLESRFEARVLCAVQVGSRTLLAIGSSGRTVRGTVQLWDPADGSHVRTLESHQNPPTALCAVQLGDRALLAAGYLSDGMARLWDPTDGSQVHALEGRHGDVEALCAVQVENRALLVTAGTEGGAVRLWDLCAASWDRSVRTHEGEVAALCALQVGNRTLLAVGDDGHSNKKVRLRDPADGSHVLTLESHQISVGQLCAVKAEDRTLLAAANQLWDPSDGSYVRTLESQSPQGVSAVCAVQAGNRTLLAVGYHGGRTRLWDPADGSQVHVLEGPQRGVRALCAVQAGNRTLLAVGGYDHYDYDNGYDDDNGIVRLWDPADGSHVRTLGSQRGVSAMCAVQAGNRTLLAVGYHGGMVRLRDPADGSHAGTLEGHQDSVQAVCTVQVGNRTLLVTGSSDTTVRFWDPAEGRCVLTVPVHHGVSALAQVADSLAVGLTAGVLAIEFEWAALV